MTLAKTKGLPKGQKCTVLPIKTVEHVNAVKALLAGHPRNYLLFVIGVNSGLRCADIVRLKVGQLKGQPVGHSVHVVETKTGKRNFFHINQAIFEALQNYWTAYPDAHDDHYLFHTTYAGQSVPTQHIKTQAVGYLIRDWVAAVGLNGGSYGCHTLRKTFGYIQRTVFNVDWAILTKRYNHSHPSVTAAYLGVDDVEVAAILDNCI